MVIDNLSDIAHAAVADLDCVAVKCFPQFVAWWGMLVYQNDYAIARMHKNSKSL